MAECIHFPDDPNANCSLCKPKPKVDPWETEAWPEFKSIFTAIYHGTCCKCDQHIYPGDSIVREGNEYRHQDCRAHG